MSSELRCVRGHGVDHEVRHPARLAAGGGAQRRFEQGEALVEVAAPPFHQAVGEHHQASPVELERVVLVLAVLDPERRPRRDGELDGRPDSTRTGDG